MTSPFPSASDVSLAIAGPPGSPLLTVFPELAAATVMGVVGPVLEARDAEIRRLLAGAGENSSEDGEAG